MRKLDRRPASVLVCALRPAARRSNQKDLIEMRTLSSHHGRRAGLCAVVLALLLPALAAPSASAQTAYVTNLSAASVTPFDTETGLVGTPIPVGASPRAAEVTPDGSTASLVNLQSDAVTPAATAQAPP